MTKACIINLPAFLLFVYQVILYTNLTEDWYKSVPGTSGKFNTCRWRHIPGRKDSSRSPIRDSLFRHHNYYLQKIRMFTQ